jgi:hypothetical protein
MTIRSLLGWVERGEESRIRLILRDSRELTTQKSAVYGHFSSPQKRQYGGYALL